MGSSLQLGEAEEVDINENNHFTMSFSLDQLVGHSLRFAQNIKSSPEPLELINA